MGIKVAIVEDIQDIRESLRFLVSGSDGFEVYVVAENAEEALALINTDNTDVVLMDIGLPGLNGVDCTHKIREKYPTIQIIICTVYEDDAMLFEALKAGATGYILKKSMADEIIQAIREVHNGGSPMSSGLARRVVESFYKESSQQSGMELLSSREQEIIALLAEGYRYKEIAGLKYISIDTVRSHIRHIYEKLQVQSKIEAINKVYPKQ